MELESRITKIIFADDIFKFVNMERIDSHLDDMISAFRGNSVERLNLKKEIVEKWGEYKDWELLEEIAPFLRDEAGYIVEFQTPIVSNITMKGNRPQSWSSSGFAFCRNVVMYVKGFENLKPFIAEFEENLMMEIHKEEQGEQENV